LGCPSFLPPCLLYFLPSSHHLSLRVLDNIQMAVFTSRKFQVEGVDHTNRSFSQKARLNDLLCGIKIWTDFSSVLSHCTRLTEGWTDSFLVARPRCIQCMQRGINRKKYTSFCGLVYKNMEVFI